ncbi:MAG: hypothetical protein R3A11_06005 [Bdellovibrionota bacterium]
MLKLIRTVGEIVALWAVVLITPSLHAFQPIDFEGIDQQKKWVRLFMEERTFPDQDVQILSHLIHLPRSSDVGDPSIKTLHARNFMRDRIHLVQYLQQKYDLEVRELIVLVMDRLVSVLEHQDQYHIQPLPTEAGFSEMDASHFCHISRHLEKENTQTPCQKTALDVSRQNYEKNRLQVVLFQSIHEYFQSTNDTLLTPVYGEEHKELLKQIRAQENKIFTYQGSASPESKTNCKALAAQKAIGLKRRIYNVLYKVNVIEDFLEATLHHLKTQIEVFDQEAGMNFGYNEEHFYRFYQMARQIEYAKMAVKALDDNDPSLINFNFAMHPYSGIEITDDQMFHVQSQQQWGMGERNVDGLSPETFVWMESFLFGKLLQNTTDRFYGLLDNLYEHCSEEDRCRLAQKNGAYDSLTTLEKLFNFRGREFNDLQGVAGYVYKNLMISWVKQQSSEVAELLAALSQGGYQNISFDEFFGDFQMLFLQPSTRQKQTHYISECWKKMQASSQANPYQVCAEELRNYLVVSFSQSRTTQEKNRVAQKYIRAFESNQKLKKQIDENVSIAFCGEEEYKEITYYLFNYYQNIAPKTSNQYLKIAIMQDNPITQASFKPCKGLIETDYENTNQLPNWFDTNYLAIANVRQYP